MPLASANQRKKLLTKLLCYDQRWELENIYIYLHFVSNEIMGILILWAPHWKSPQCTLRLVGDEANRTMSSTNSRNQTSTLSLPWLCLEVLPVNHTNRKGDTGHFWYLPVGGYIYVTLDLMQRIKPAVQEPRSHSVLLIPLLGFNPATVILVKADLLSADTWHNRRLTHTHSRVLLFIAPY